MKRFISVLVQAICVILIAIGVLAALITSSIIGALLVARHHEGRLLAEDWRMFATTARWLALSCSVTGLALWIRSKFTEKRGDDTFRLVKPTPGERERLVQQVFQNGLFALLAVCLWSVVSGTAFLRMASVAGWLTVTFLAMHVRILIHELGHLGAAWIMRFQLQKIQVGVGPVLWSHSFAKYLRFEWRVWPHGGFVSANDPKRKDFKLRQSFFIGAGPLSDVLMLWLAFRLIEFLFGGLTHALGRGAGGLLICVLFFWSAWTTIGALVPRGAWVGYRKLWTDGYQLVRVWTASKDQVHEFILNPNWREALQLLQSTTSKDTTSSTSAESIPAGQAENIQAFRQQQARLGSRLLPKSERASTN